MVADYLPARCSCGAGVAGTMISDSRPWYACGTVAGRPCIAEVVPITPPYAVENLEPPTPAELASIRGLVDAFTIAIEAAYTDAEPNTTGSPGADQAQGPRVLVRGRGPERRRCIHGRTEAQRCRQCDD